MALCRGRIRSRKVRKVCALRLALPRSEAHAGSMPGHGPTVTPWHGSSLMNPVAFWSPVATKEVRS